MLASKPTPDCRCTRVHVSSAALAIPDSLMGMRQPIQNLPTPATCPPDCGPACSSLAICRVVRLQSEDSSKRIAQAQSNNSQQLNRLQKMPRAAGLASLPNQCKISDISAAQAYNSTLREVALRRQFRARSAPNAVGTLISRSMPSYRGYLAQCEKALTTLSRTGRTPNTEGYRAILHAARVFCRMVEVENSRSPGPELDAFAKSWQLSSHAPIWTDR